MKSISSTKLWPAIKGYSDLVKYMIVSVWLTMNKSRVLCGIVKVGWKRLVTCTHGNENGGVTLFYFSDDVFRRVVEFRIRFGEYFDFLRFSDVTGKAITFLADTVISEDVVAIKVR